MDIARVIAWVKVVLTAAPAVLAAVTAVLTVVAVNVVPALPGPLGVQVAGWVASALAVVAAVSRVVAMVSPVPEDERGVLPSG